MNYTLKRRVENGEIVFNIILEEDEKERVKYLLDNTTEKLISTKYGAFEIEKDFLEGVDIKINILNEDAFMSCLLEVIKLLDIKLEELEEEEEIEGIPMDYLPKEERLRIYSNSITDMWEREEIDVNDLMCFIKDLLKVVK